MAYKVKSLVITGFGINCEEETAAAYRLAGAEATVVHLNEILLDGFSIHGFDVLNFPGGFSFGDDIASGRVLANKIRFKQLPDGGTFLVEIKKFVARGKFVLGICNGFQVLAKLGLLPDVAGETVQEATLTRNDSGRFENRWVHCKVSPNAKTPFLKGLDVIALPVRHGEGKLIVKNEALKRQIVAQSLNCLTYCTPSGEPSAKFPFNPNGSELGCAGLCSPNGQVFGLMPHPEAYLSVYNHPNSRQMLRQNPQAPEEGEGLQLFKNIVVHIEGQKRRLPSPP